MLPHVARRRALATGLVLACLAAAPGCGNSGVPGAVPGAEPIASRRAVSAGLDHAEGVAPRRPNMLVIETDDMRWDDLRFMPHVRRLIQDRGLSFENSFAPYPLCAPSRSSFLTGEYAHNHRVYTHLDPYGFAALKDRHTIATVLQGAGYRTGLVGKYVNGYGEQFLRSGKPSLHYVPPGWDQWYAGSDHLWDFDNPNYGGGTYSYTHLVQNINGEIESFPGQYSTDVVAEQARGVIDGFSKDKLPWFVWWTPTAPHHGLPVEPDDPKPTRRRDGQFDDWDTPGRPDWVKGRFDRVIRHGSGTPPRHSAEADVHDKPVYLKKLPELTSAEKAAETEVTRQRAEALYALDVQIRNTLAHLRKIGQLRHTIIVFTSDNGYYLGEHRKREGKVNLHEPSLRVPLLVAGPGVPHGRRYDPVTTIDLAPTFASYAGTTMADTDGTSFLPVISGGDQGWRRPVVTEGMMGFGRYDDQYQLGLSPLDTRGLRLGRWKLMRYSTGEQELYDLWKDPLELQNLARTPADATVLHEMRGLFDEYWNCHGDGCRAPLPARFQVSPAEEKRITDHQVAATNAYFDN